MATAVQKQFTLEFKNPATGEGISPIAQAATFEDLTRDAGIAWSLACEKHPIAFLSPRIAKALAKSLICEEERSVSIEAINNHR